MQHALYHRGAWDASAPDKPPTPVHVANSTAEIREYLINLVGATISTDPKKHTKAQILELAGAASADARRTTAEAKREKRRIGHQRRAEARRTGKPAIVHYMARPKSP